MKIAIILGTRPEIIKMSPIIKECKKRKINFFVLHSNQHYSANLDKIFFNELRLPNPKYNLNIGSGTHGQQISKMLLDMETVLSKEHPDIVLVQGDTNTALAGALSAAKLNIKVAHIEAGLRSYFREMPEELNRTIADHCSDFLFAPTQESKNNLLKEGISDNRVFIVGNTIVDSVIDSMKSLYKKSKIIDKLQLKKDKYFLLTLHRQENVDNEKRIKNIFNGAELVHKKFNMDIICPLHPRTKKMISQLGVNIGNYMKMIEPLGYFDFINLEKNARLIFTDSGGVQEEACIFGVPCITLRDNTERPETLKIKSNVLAGANPNKILKCTKLMLESDGWKNPFGNGKSAEKIINVICKKIA